jgi:hypothetical protein
MKHLIYGVFSFCFALGLQAQATSLTYWYETPNYPGDGASVSQNGQLSRYQARGDTLSYQLAFPATKSAEFTKLGGWMTGITGVEGQLSLIPDSQMVNDLYYGQVEGSALVRYGNGSSQTVNVLCLESRDSGQRSFDCYFPDHTNSYRFTEKE